MLGLGMRGKRKRRRGRNVPCFDGRALAVLLAIISMLIAAVWFGHARLEINNNPPLQGFTPRAR
jgi:hypothetical protein